MHCAELGTDAGNKTSHFSMQVDIFQLIFFSKQLGLDLGRAAGKLCYDFRTM